MRKILFALVGVGALATVVLVACPQEKKAEPPPAPAVPVAAPAPPPAVPAGKGNISGEVLLTGTPPLMEPLKLSSEPVCNKKPRNDESALVKDGKIENVVLRVKGPAVPPPADRVQVVQTECMYRPRVQVAQVGQEISVANEDGILHNVHSYLGTKTIDNRAQPPRSPPVERKAEGEGILKLKCDVHPWMTAYVALATNPWFAVTKADGKFEIKDVPAGQYALEVWHEKFGTKTVPVTVAPDQTAKVDVTYSAEDRG